MIKFTLHVLILFIVAEFVFATSIDWNVYKELHEKSYADPVEDQMRRQIFEKNKLEVERFNAEGSAKLGYEKGLNQFSDRTSSEIKQLLGFRLTEGTNIRNSAEDQAFLANILADNSSKVEEQFDWREKEGIVTPIKNQGNCGSCWAFSATGVLEGQQLRHSEQTKLVPLSEQNMMDCRPEGNGCQGGYPGRAIDLVKQEGGINSELDYPYVGLNSVYCRFVKSKPIMTSKGAASLARGDEEHIKEVVAKYGPVSVCFDVYPDSFLAYKSGVYKEDRCDSSTSNHCVLIVGYGTDPREGDYWIVKNSWGERWGEQGYVRMGRGYNTCGVANWGIIATF